MKLYNETKRNGGRLFLLGDVPVININKLTLSAIKKNRDNLVKNEKGDYFSVYFVDGYYFIKQVSKNKDGKLFERDIIHKTYKKQSLIDKMNNY